MENYKKHLLNIVHLTEEQWNKIENVLVVKQFKKNEFILVPGEYSEDYFFVESGVIRSYTIDENGKEHVLQFGTENWIVSDRNSAFCKQQSKFYIQAIEDSTVVLLNEKLVDLIVSLNPEYLVAQNKLVQNHVRSLQDRINLLLGATAKTRYLEFIRLYPNQLSRIPQWMIASYLGITPESLSRVRKEIAHG
ncbi:cAMP-binding domain of CRP or a regulatory subunit of cAMP-dependent protein kinases [Algoriella xinjiangensis]|uniref:cAMP-binding domain of CRP or a regulatory subunit of cAMP-dependent protein kinases n=1 Tax=Algoriella xinjiangensis TaxID=684065 RepID=A0A1I4SAM6_9FLAO|nr:Crp/Fnr family transcriptional regulator [Algoriella xinjiangensis]SFM61522.1 cAMP-binding domain of CRP or a regulatory subunit of cAMP-dependent protein kinases [Algoriella xinjiangensis]VDH15982.1 Fumarate and nitrate reduction regulatory protein [Algoriella xinjiangensis]